MSVTTLAQEPFSRVFQTLGAMEKAASDAIGEEQPEKGDRNAPNWAGGAEQPAQGKPFALSADEHGRADPNSEVNVERTFWAGSAEQPGRADPNSEVSVEHTFTTIIVSAASGEPMMSAVHVGPQLTIGNLKRSLPNYAVNSSTEVAATRMRFFRDSSELRVNDTVAPQNHQAFQITLKAIVDPRLCACGNQPDTDLVCMCDYCYFGACDSCLYDHGERFCGHCDKFICGNCLTCARQKQDITLGWSSCGRCEWKCPECVASNTPCKYFMDADFKVGLVQETDALRFGTSILQLLGCACCVVVAQFDSMDRFIAKASASFSSAAQPEANVSSSSAAQPARQLSTISAVLRWLSTLTESKISLN